MFRIHVAQSVQLSISWSQLPENFTAAQPKLSYSDSAAAMKEVERMINRMREAGFPAASVDSVQMSVDTLYIYAYAGQRMRWLQLHNGNLADGIYRDLSVNNRIRFNNIPLLKEKALQQFENNGFPFAQVWLDSFEQHGETVKAALCAEPFDLFLFDTLQIESSKRLKRRFMETYLGIKTGKPYREKSVRAVNRKLGQMNYVETTAPADVSFSNARARATLHLRDRKASVIDLLLGILPNGANQKVLITGQAKIHLVSLLGMGEEFFLQWEKLQDKTQDLDVRIAVPYLFYLPLGIKGRFYLYKRDTTWIQLNGEYGVQYLFSGNNYVYAGVKQHFAFLQQTDTAFIRQFRKLPPQQDVASNEFQVKFFKHTLDYFFNPRKGWWLEAEMSAGARIVKRNSTVTQLFDPVENRGFGYLYDTTRLRTFTATAGATVVRYFSIGRQFAVKTSLEGKLIYSYAVNRNEMFRLGGLQSLRGFDEQSLFTPYYALANAEFRFLFERNSYFYTFINAALIQSQRNFQFNHEFPFGFGAGVAASTKIGIFQVAYALGKAHYEPVDFRKSKIHFGYINLF